jgi:hypothetical protein
MTLTLSLPPELEQYLIQEAQQQGLSVETYAVQLLQKSTLQKEKQLKIVNVLQSWIDESDEQEQQETGEYLINALDENRLSNRQLFPQELKGISW